MEKAVVLLGSNMGGRMRFIDTAAAAVARRCGAEVARSAVYESEAWGFESDNFLNMALVVETAMEPYDFFAVTRLVEGELGRRRDPQAAAGQYAPRPIDIDILFFGDRVLRDESLTIPHPRIAARRFVLEPLAEIMPHYEHPTLRLPVDELLRRCADMGAVWRYNP